MFKLCDFSFVLIYFILMPSPYFSHFIFMNILQSCHFKLMIINIVFLLFKFLDGILKFVEVMVIIAVPCESLSKTSPMANSSLKCYSFIWRWLLLVVMKSGRERPYHLCCELMQGLMVQGQLQNILTEWSAAVLQLILHHDLSFLKGLISKSFCWEQQTHGGWCQHRKKAMQELMVQRQL